VAEAELGQLDHDPADPQPALVLFVDFLDERGDFGVSWFLQPGPLVDGEGLVLDFAALGRHVHPISECAVVDPEVPGYLGDRPARGGDQPHSLGLKGVGVLLPCLAHCLFLLVGRRASGVTVYGSGRGLRQGRRDRQGLQGTR
jgi:hypothetical protein